MKQVIKVKKFLNFVYENYYFQKREKIEEEKEEI